MKREWPLVSIEIALRVAPAEYFLSLAIYFSAGNSKDIRQCCANFIGSAGAYIGGYVSPLIKLPATLRQCSIINIVKPRQYSIILRKNPYLCSNDIYFGIRG